MSAVIKLWGLSHTSVKFVPAALTPEEDLRMREGGYGGCHGQGGVKSKDWTKWNSFHL